MSPILSFVIRLNPGVDGGNIRDNSPAPASTCPQEVLYGPHRRQNQERKAGRKTDSSVRWRWSLS
ncbi:hypothetical protein EMIT0158MI4_120004 [Burkholderia ambifaria]